MIILYISEYKNLSLRSMLIEMCTPFMGSSNTSFIRSSIVQIKGVANQKGKIKNTPSKFVSNYHFWTSNILQVSIVVEGLTQNFKSIKLEAERVPSSLFTSIDAFLFMRKTFIRNWGSKSPNARKIVRKSSASDQV